FFFFFFQAEDGIRDKLVTGVQTCALPIFNWPRRLSGHANVSYAAFSPDGRYVATGTWRGTGVRIWDADTGRQVATLPARESAGRSEERRVGKEWRSRGAADR